MLRETQSWVSFDAELKDVATRLEGQITEVRDLADMLRLLSQNWEADPERLDELEKRLQLLRRLEKKYGRPTDELSAYRATWTRRRRHCNDRKTISPPSPTS